MSKKGRWGVSQWCLIEKVVRDGLSTCVVGSVDGGDDGDAGERLKLAEEEQGSSGEMREGCV